MAIAWFDSVHRSSSVTDTTCAQVLISWGTPPACLRPPKPPPVCLPTSLRPPPSRTPDTPPTTSRFLKKFGLAEIMVLAGTAGAGRMAPSASTRISARLKFIQEHSSVVKLCAEFEIDSCACCVCLVVPNVLAAQIQKGTSSDPFEALECDNLRTYRATTFD